MSNSQKLNESSSSQQLMYSKNQNLLTMESTLGDLIGNGNGTGKANGSRSPFRREKYLEGRIESMEKYFDQREVARLQEALDAKSKDMQLILTHLEQEKIQNERKNNLINELKLTMNSDVQEPTERLISEIGDLNGLISTKGEQIRLLHVKVNELTTVNKSLNSENERLTQEKRDLRNELKSRDSPVRGLTIKTADMGYVNPSTILKLENHIALLTTELTRMNNDFNDKSGECLDANSQLNEQKLSMSKLDRENERLSNDISSMASDLAFKLEAIGRLEAENLKLRNEVSAMRHQAHVSNSSLIKVKDQFQSEYLTSDKLKERYEQEHKFILDLKYQLQQEKNCVHDLKTKFYQMETNNEESKIENSDLHKQVRVLRDSVDFYENENVRQSKEFEIRYETL